VTKHHVAVDPVDQPARAAGADQVVGAGRVDLAAVADADIRRRRQELTTLKAMRLPAIVPSAAFRWVAPEAELVTLATTNELVSVSAEKS
jgi:hypothetical protein